MFVSNQKFLRTITAEERKEKITEQQKKDKF